MMIFCCFEGKERMVEVHRNVVVIGRRSAKYGTPDLDLLPDKNVSRRHARLWRDADGYWIEDLNSQLGVLVNGVRALGKRQIKFTDRILVGKTELRVVPSDAKELAAKV